jgi:hypothetical protein
MKENKILEFKNSNEYQKEDQNYFSTVNFSKADPLYKCRSASFYTETNELFTYRDCPHVK